jgi:predicted ATPase
MQSKGTSNLTRAAARPGLIGRGTELAAIEAQRRRAIAGELRVLLITGDPGLGKTRLVERFLERHRRSLVPLVGRASLFSGTAPFGIWVEAIERHLRQLPAGAVTQVCGDRAETLSWLLPSVAAAHGRPPPQPPSRTWLLDALSLLLGRLARWRPLAVFLDDLHLSARGSRQSIPSRYSSRSTMVARP